MNLQNRWLDMIVGGWNFGNVFSFSTGGPTQLGGSSNTFNSFAPQGVQLAPGVTLQQVSDAFHGQPLIKMNDPSNTDQRLNRGSQTNDWTRLAIPLEFVKPDGRANPNFFTFSNTPGQIGQILYIYDKNSFSWNSSLTKTFKVTERMNFQLYAEGNNIMNHPSWGMGSVSSNSTSFGTTGAPGGARSMTFRGLLSF